MMPVIRTLCVALLMAMFSGCWDSVSGPVVLNESGSDLVLELHYSDSSKNEYNFKTNQTIVLTHNDRALEKIVILDLERGQSKIISHDQIKSYANQRPLKLVVIMSGLKIDRRNRF